MQNCRLIVGLGNPGAAYRDTRHNAGYLVTERLAGRWGAGWRSDSKLQARLARSRFGTQAVALVQPLTYMNLSGQAVRAAADYYRVAPGNLLVISDDADLPLGQIRLRRRGSSGGHHGLESIEQHLGTREYARLRLGIGRQEGGREITGYVLDRFRPEDRELLDKVLDRAADQVECWLELGIQAAMDKYNGKVVS